LTTLTLRAYARERDSQTRREAGLRKISLPVRQASGTAADRGARSSAVALPA
jgi:hypothetical protein